MSRKPDRKAQILERIWHELGANRLEQRWVTDKHGVEGLAYGKTIIVSPLPLVPVIIHEALHRAYPEWAEATVARHTTYLYHRMTDDECHRLYDAYAAKVNYISKSIPSE